MLALAARDAYSNVDQVKPVEDLEAHILAYHVDPWCYACQKAIARDVAATPLVIQKYNKAEKVWEDIDPTAGGPGAELHEWFQWPQERSTWREISERWTLSLLATGNGFLGVDPDDKDFFNVKPSWVSVGVDSLGRPTAYTATNAGLKRYIDIENMIHTRLVAADGEYFGNPPSAVLKKTILANLRLKEYLQSFFENGGQLGVYITTQQSMNEEQRREQLKAFNREHQGAIRAFRTAAFSDGMTPGQLDIKLKDLVPAELGLMIRQEVLAVYGVPPVKLGLLDGAAWANANIQEKSYQLDTVEPYRGLNEETLNVQFVWPRYGMDYRVRYDRSEVPALRQDETAVTATATQVWNAGGSTLNEYREKIGYPPIDDERGDQFRYELVTAQYDFGQDDPGALAASPSHAKGVRSSRASIWKSFDRRLSKTEKAQEKLTKRFFAGQLDRVLAGIDTVTGKGVAPSAIGLVVKATPDDDSLKKVFNKEIEDAKIIDEIGGSFERTVEASGDAALRAFGIPGSINVKNPQVQIFIERMKNRLPDINKTTWNKVQSALKESYDAAESVEQIKAKIQGIYTEWSGVDIGVSRARKIARTESIAMANGGADLAYAQNGVKAREWLATQDDTTRDSHYEADGQVRRIGEPFLVGGALLMFPGDPSGPPGEIIQCRCTTIPVLEMDE